MLWALTFQKKPRTVFVIDEPHLKTDPFEGARCLPDYLFLDGERPKNAPASAEKMGEEFRYWYPLDFRNSGTL